jgi:hypothetical protein
VTVRYTSRSPSWGASLNSICSRSPIRRGCASSPLQAPVALAVIAAAALDPAHAAVGVVGLVGVVLVEARSRTQNVLRPAEFTAELKRATRFHNDRASNPVIGCGTSASQSN